MFVKRRPITLRGAVEDRWDAGWHQRVADLRPGSAGSGPFWITPVGPALYFTADDGTHGRELFKLVP